MRGPSFVSSWMPALTWMVVIFAASTDLGSAEHTSRFLVPFLRWLDPELSPATLTHLLFFVRKAAHVSEYAILALLLLRGLRAQTRRTLARHVAIVFLLAATYAATDEFHQSFSPSRTASARDVLVDCAGVLLGLAVYLLLAKGNRPAMERGALR